MRAFHRENMVSLARDCKGLFCEVTKAAIETDFVVPSKLEAGLKAKGFEVTYTDGAKHGTWVKVTRNPTREDVAIGATETVTIAQAFSHDGPDALLQAVYAEMKEEAKRAAA